MKNWIESGTRSELAKVIVAPKDFMMRYDAINVIAGEVMRKGKTFFTRKEFEALQKQNHVPDGWRLPTIDEVKKLILEFAGDEMTSQRFVDTLRLSYGGYVYPQMKEYNEDPTELSEAIENRLLEGSYLTEGSDEGSPYVLWVHRFKSPKLQTVCPARGAKVRLVHCF